MLNLDCGVYTITSPSGGQYVGSAVSIKNRWRQHKSRLRTGKHHCRALQNAFLKYGEAALKYEVVAIVPRDQLLIREQEQIDERGFDNLYNSHPSAGGAQGYAVLPETKRKISAKLKGRVFSEDHLARMGAARRGKKQASETVEKRRQSMTGRVLSKDTRDKISRAQIGKPRPDKPGTSGFVGVTQTTWGKWRANYGESYLGHFDSAEAAAKAVERFKVGEVILATRSNNTSGYPGVVAKLNRWQATARKDGKRVYLGSFLTPDAAYKAITEFKANQ